MAHGGAGGDGSRPLIVVKLPPNWRMAKDAGGKIYYYNTRTKETQWWPPSMDEEQLEGEDDNKRYPQQISRPQNETYT